MNGTAALRSTLPLPHNTNNAKQIPRIHLGLFQTSGTTCSTAVTHALKAGYRAFDTAEWYGNERAAGSAILAFLRENGHVKREDIWFTTKLAENLSYEETKRKIRRSVEECGLGYIDLYLLHSPFGEEDPRMQRRECWRAIVDVMKEENENGETLVKCGGVSNFEVPHLLELLNDREIETKPAVNQIEVHPFNTQREITSFCKQNGIVIQAYAPLARTLKAEHPTIVELAKKYKCTWPQLFIKWSVQHGYIPLPKSVNQARIESNKEIDGFTIEDGDMRVLDALDQRFVSG